MVFFGGFKLGLFLPPFYSGESTRCPYRVNDVREDTGPNVPVFVQPLTAEERGGWDSSKHKAYDFSSI
jgi:hypothetical protein